MEKDNCLVRVENEDGKTYDMLILKEFEYKDKKYAVLTEINEDCHCGCDDECNCGDECNCDDNCNCGCNEGKECHCDHDCKCEDEPFLCLLEVAKDKDGNEIFKSIDDEKLFNKLIEEADKVLYED